MLYELTIPTASAAQHHQQTPQTSGRITSLQQKDYSRPLHVDCSVEYELPSQVKPPPTTDGKIDPLLMIHPCYFRKIEAQRRSPFINNLPGRNTTTTTTTAAATTSSSSPPSCSRTRIVTQKSCSQSNSQQIRNHYSQFTNNNTRTSTRHHQQQWQPTDQIQFIESNNHIIHNHMNQSLISNKSTEHLLKQQIKTDHQIINPDQLLSSMNGSNTDQYNSIGLSAVGMYNSTSTTMDGGLWNTNHHHSPLAAERFPETSVTLVHQQLAQPTNVCNQKTAQQHLINSKYRQYLRSHRLHPYMSMTASAFPQMQQISCYNV